ncbi:MAG TPA: response regulator [Pyrinomonadaceae bacterium]|nr:response regulator [Pyrinomonadaceae bacterium]
MLSGRRKLLLADDSPTVRKVVEMFFEEEGYEVVTVGGGEEALRELDSERPPDVLLADAVMPGPDGYMLCERVKRDARLAAVPVVLLVGTFEPFNEAEARRVGADTVLTKPFQSIRDLVSKVGSLLGGESKHEGEQAQHASAPDERAGAAARSVDDAPPRAHAEEPPQASAADSARGFDAATDSPYADLGADDELIEAKPADAFGLGTADEDSTGADEQVRPPRDVYAQTPHDAHARPSNEPERFGAREYEHARANGRASAAHASSSFVTPSSHAEENQMPAQSPFEARAASAAAADDALLDLGQLEQHHRAATSTAVEDDDFILDLDDEPSFTLDTPSAFAEASHGEQAAPFSEVSGSEVSEPLSESAAFVSEPSESFDESAETFSEPAVPFAASAQTFSEDAHARTPSENESTFDSVGPRQPSPGHDAPAARAESNSFMQDGPQGFASYVAPQGLASAPRGFVEPEVVPADLPVPAAVEGEFTDGSVEGDLPKAPAAVAEAPQAEPSTAGYSVVEGRTRVEEPVRADQLSPEMIDAVARRVVEMMSDKVVREIVWEVVPDLAELLIRQKLEEEGKSKG